MKEHRNSVPVGAWRGDDPRLAPSTLDLDRRELADRQGEEVGRLRIAPVPHRRKHPPLADERMPRLWNKPGMFPSFKSGGDVPFWGPLQREFLVLMEGDRRVRSILTRAASFDWWDGETMHAHVPDFLLSGNGARTMVDVEPMRATKGHLARLRFLRLRAACKTEGFGYRVVTDDWIRRQPRLTNNEMVCGNMGWNIPETDLNLLRQCARRIGAICPADIVAIGLLSEGRAMAAALNLVWRAELRVDMGRRITAETLFREARP